MKASVANRIGVDGQIISVSSAARERTRLSDPPTNCVARFAKYNWSERSIIVRAGLLLIYQFRTNERTSIPAVPKWIGVSDLEDGFTRVWSVRGNRRCSLERVLLCQVVWRASVSKLARFGARRCWLDTCGGKRISENWRGVFWDGTRWWHFPV